jgi:hypothetical protein
MLRNGFDQPNGIIIGGDFYTGRLYYGDRPQGGKFYADTEAELIAQARQQKHQIIRDNHMPGVNIYPDDSQWQLRIYN